MEVPPFVDEYDECDRAESAWWKIKKWCCHVASRIFERYGSPGNVDEQYQDFANFWLKNYSIKGQSLYNINQLTKQSNGCTTPATTKKERCKIYCASSSSTDSELRRNGRGTRANLEDSKKCIQRHAHLYLISASLFLGRRQRSLGRWSTRVHPLKVRRFRRFHLPKYRRSDGFAYCLFQKKTRLVFEIFSKDFIY